MQCLAVDFASRFSAAVLMDAHKTVLSAWVSDALGVDKPFRVYKHLPPLEGLVSSFVGSSEIDWANCRFIVEDLSHGMANPGPALRLQGAFLSLLYKAGIPEPEMLLPSRWQAYYEFVKRSKKNPTAPTIKAQAKVTALGFGYQFGTVGKSTVDLYDAALIARYGIETWER